MAAKWQPNTDLLADPSDVRKAASYLSSRTMDAPNNRRVGHRLGNNWRRKSDAWQRLGSKFLQSAAKLFFQPSLGSPGIPAIFLGASNRRRRVRTVAAKIKCTRSAALLPCGWPAFFLPVIKQCLFFRQTLRRPTYCLLPEPSFIQHNFSHFLCYFLPVGSLFRKFGIEQFCFT